MHSALVTRHFIFMRILWPALFLCSLLALAFGPGLLTREPASDEELTVISPHWEGIRSEFGRAFSEHYFKQTGRRLRVVWLDYGGTSEVTKFVIERFRQVREKGGDGVGADIFFGGGMDNLPTLAKADCFEPVALPPEIDAKIPLEVSGQPLRDAQQRYYAACLSGFGFVYNADVIARAKLNAPEKWSDLGRPEFRGWISSGDPSISGSVHQAFEIVLQSEGWERGCATLSGMLSNARAFNEGGPSVPRDVSLGQAAAGACIDFYATAPIRRQAGAQLKFVIPSGASVVTPDGIAMMRGAPNRAAALEFVRFTLSESGQKLWYLARDPEGKNGAPKYYDLERLPVMPELYERGLPTNTVLNPFKNKADFIYDGKQASARWTMLNHFMRAMWVDAHEEMWSARGAVIAAGRENDLGVELLQPLSSEPELLALAGKRLTPDEINKLKNAWTSRMIAHCNSIERAAKSGGKWERP